MSSSTVFRNSSEYYEKLIDYGISEKTSVELDRLFSEGKMSFGDLDDRALDALKEFEVEGGVCVLRQLASDGECVCWFE